VMKAAVATRYGPPEVVQVTDVPRPVPKADELLVRVHATTVNRTDCGFRAAHPPPAVLAVVVCLPSTGNLGGGTSVTRL
jgi:NADPH:quinone reductase-like Zn-dependent oxidoreductase